MFSPAMAMLMLQKMSSTMKQNDVPIFWCRSCYIGMPPKPHEECSCLIRKPDKHRPIGSSSILPSPRGRPEPKHNHELSRDMDAVVIIDGIPCSNIPRLRLKASDEAVDLKRAGKLQTSRDPATGPASKMQKGRKKIWHTAPQRSWIIFFKISESIRWYRMMICDISYTYNHLDL